MLDIISDETLAHGRADRHRRVAGLVILRVFIQRGMDQADLRRIAVGDDKLASFFDQVGKNFYRRMYSFILPGKICSQSLVTKCNNNAFLTHNPTPSPG